MNVEMEFLKRYHTFIPYEKSYKDITKIIEIINKGKE
jgi:hypothetical protein